MSKETSPVLNVQTAEPVLKFDGLRRVFKQGQREIVVLSGASGQVMPGEAVALVGPSGSGKSTVLHIAGLLETPDAGNVSICGQSCSGLDDRSRTRVRRHEMGFIYQFHQLLPEFSALENVALPLMLTGVARGAAEARAEELLKTVGLGHRLDHRPGQLSGGEQQRTAICRALANRPRLILADEPTGNLDPQTSELVFHELVSLIRSEGVSALIATHNLDLAARMDRVFKLDVGLLVEVHPSNLL